MAPSTRIEFAVYARNASQRAQRALGARTRLIYVTAATTGGTGTLQVRSPAGTPVNFPFTGFTNLTLDVIVRPTDPYAVLVSLQPAGGASYIGFKQVSHTTQPGV